MAWLECLYQAIEDPVGVFRKPEIAAILARFATVFKKLIMVTLMQQAMTFVAAFMWGLNKLGIYRKRRRASADSKTPTSSATTSDPSPCPTRRRARARLRPRRIRGPPRRARAPPSSLAGCSPKERSPVPPPRSACTAWTIPPRETPRSPRRRRSRTPRRASSAGVPAKILPELRHMAPLHAVYGGVRRRVKGTGGRDSPTSIHDTGVSASSDSDRSDDEAADDLDARAGTRRRRRRRSPLGWRNAPRRRDHRRRGGRRDVSVRRDGRRGTRRGERRGWCARVRVGSFGGARRGGGGGGDGDDAASARFAARPATSRVASRRARSARARRCSRASVWITPRRSWSFASRMDSRWWKRCSRAPIPRRRLAPRRTRRLSWLTRCAIPAERRDAPSPPGSSRACENDSTPRLWRVTSPPPRSRAWRGTATSAIAPSRSRAALAAMQSAPTGTRARRQCDAIRRRRVLRGRRARDASERGSSQRTRRGGGGGARGDGTVVPETAVDAEEAMRRAAVIPASRA